MVSYDEKEEPSPGRAIRLGQSFCPPTPIQFDGPGGEKCAEGEGAVGEFPYFVAGWLNF